MIMTLEERAVYERLLDDYVNAELDVRRSVSRRHDALHACINFCTEYAERKKLPLT